MSRFVSCSAAAIGLWAAVPLVPPASAQCARSNNIPLPTNVFAINLTYTSEVGPPPISQGISKWTSNCPGEGTN